MAAADAPAPALPAAGLVVVTGPARSGKSRWAEHLAAASGRPVLYLATGAERPGDAGWRRRLERHRRRRPAQWHTLEVGGALAEALAELAARHPEPGPDTPVLLIDALGTWLAQHLELEPEAWRRREQELLAALAALALPVLLVGEETGWGVVPPTAIGGLFRDRLGRLERRLVARSQRTWLVVQGRALDLLALGLAVPGDDDDGS